MERKNQSKMNEMGVCSRTGGVVLRSFCHNCLNKKLLEGEKITLIRNGKKIKPVGKPCVFISIDLFPFEERVKILKIYAQKVMEYVNKRNSN